MDKQTAQNSNETVWRPEAQIGDVQTGLDVSALATDVLELNVPSRLSTIDNDVFTLSALELRDKRFMQRRAKAAASKLSANINQAMANLVANTGTLVIDVAADPTGYADIAECETVMDMLEIPIDQGRSIFLNSRDYNSMSTSLANAARSQPGTEDALRRSMIGDFAGFDTFRTNFQPVLPLTANPTITTTSAQFHIPVATTTAAGEEIPVDNRGMNLAVDTTVGVSVGDAFTIPGVFEVSHISKNDTGRLRTFRVVDVVDGTNLTIYPRLIPLDELGAGLTRAQATYANVTTECPTATALTWINTAAKTVNSFWRNGSVELIAGQIAWEADMFKGANFMRETTSSGIELVMAVEGTAMSGVVDVRLTNYYGLVNTDPQQNGIMGAFSA